MYSERHDTTLVLTCANVRRRERKKKELWLALITKRNRIHCTKTMHERLTYTSNDGLKTTTKLHSKDSKERGNGVGLHMYYVRSLSDTSDECDKWNGAAQSSTRSLCSFSFFVADLKTKWRFSSMKNECSSNESKTATSSLGIASIALCRRKETILERERERERERETSSINRPVCYHQASFWVLNPLVQLA